jgi:AcrR family transcriptional regulator
MRDDAPSESAGRREAILDAADKVFARQGYQATTVRELEEAADTSRSGLFLDYHGMRELYLAVIQRQQMEGLVPAVARAMTEASSAAQLLRGMLEAIRAWHQTHPEAIQLFQQAGHHQETEPDLAQLDAQINESMSAFLAAVVGSLQRREILNDALEPAAIMRLIHQLMDLVYAETAHMSEDDALDSALPTFSVLLEGIGHPPDPPEA